MAQVATNGQKATMRKAGQWSDMYAAIFFPHTVYSARLLAVPSTTDMVAEITFNSGSGTLGNVKADMTLWVGTTAGAYDLGMCRIRKAPIAGTFYIGEQSHVDWQSTCYLTVVDDFDLKAKHPHVDNDGVMSMDYDIVYSNQHTVFKPVPVLGPVVRVKKLTGADVDVQLGPESGDASWVLGSTISTYLWSIPTASAVSSTSVASPVATFDTVGWHICYCTVTAANGQTKLGARYVYIWDDDNLPLKLVDSPIHDENSDTGGSNFSITLASDAALTDIPSRALCVLFSIDHYGDYLNDEIDTVGDITDAENIECVGRIASESITYDSEKSQVSFDVQGYQEWFKKTPGFPAGLEIAVNTPDVWSVMPALTVDRFLWHFLEWRCTATTIMDVNLTDDDLYADKLTSLSGDLWSQMNEVLFDSLLGYMSVDKYGRFFAQIEPQMIPEANRDWVTVMTLTKDDFFDSSQIERVITPPVSQVEFSGVYVDVSGRSNSFFSVSHGRIPGDYGTLQPEDKYLVSGQADANQKAGLLLGWATNEYKPITLNLLNNKMISCFPRQFVEYTLDATDTIRGVEMTINLIPRRRRLIYNPQTGFKYYQVEFEAETFEQVAVKGDTPGTTETGIQPIPGFPDIPGYPDLIFDDISSTPDGPPVVLIIDSSDGILLSQNFNEPEPGDILWQFWNSGIDAVDVPLIASSRGVRMFVCPNGAVYVPIADKSNARWFDIVYRAPAIGGMFEKVIDSTWLDANEGTDGRILGIGYNPLKPEEVAFIAYPGGTGTGHFWIGSNLSWTQKASIGLATTFAGGLTFGGGKWIFEEQNSANTACVWNRFSADGATLEFTSASLSNRYHVRAGTTAKIYKAASTELIVSLDNADNISSIAVAEGFGTQNLAVSPNGGYMMANWDSGDRGRSADSGNTWVGLPNLPAGGEYVWAFAGGGGLESRWIAARGVVRYSPDFGETWLNKEGNLLYIIPVGMQIMKIIVPGIPS